MKKQILLLAGAALIFASCGSGENKTEDNAADTQAKIDSAVNAQVAAHEAEIAAKQDSIIKAAEAEKAAAEAAAAEAAKKATTKKTPKTPKAEPASPAPPPPAPTVGNGKPSMGTQTTTNQNTGNTVGNGKPKMGK